jgi:DNA polymerase III delta prime subunit
MQASRAARRHHAYAIGAPLEAGIAAALAWIERELGMAGRTHPDIAILEYGLFSVDEARRVGEIAMRAPVEGESRAVIIAVSRAYRDAQNVLLKLFEEPPPGTYLFLVLPTLGNLLPTLRSRVQVLPHERPDGGGTNPRIPETARAFLAATREGRSAIVKRLTAGRDEDERRAYRDEALAIIDGIEVAAYEKRGAGLARAHIELLEELQAFRGYLHDPSAPVKMILEHLAIVTPRDLL